MSENLSKKKFYLVDVSPLFFRAFYAIRPLTSPAGVPVNAVYGYLSMVVKLLKDEKPDYFVFCYDRKEPSFRKELYPEYKANRTEMPEELAVQIPYIKKLAELLGIPTLEKESFEADDLIGSLVSLGLQNQCDVVIVSGDKDFAQLVQPGVTLLDTMKDTRLDSAGVFEKWGIHPEQMVDYLSIVGDSSDNVPGVDGIGPKGATKLLAEYGSLDGIYKHVNEISSASVREKLLKSKDQALMARKLVTIVKDIPLTSDITEFTRKPLLRDELRTLLQELNFKTFEKNLLSDSSATEPLSSATAARGESQSSFQQETPQRELTESEFLDQIEPGQILWVYDFQEKIIFSDGKVLFHVQQTPESLKNFGKVLDQKMILWKGFDLKKNWHALGVQTPMAGFDGMLAAYVLKTKDCSDMQSVFKDHFGEEEGGVDTPSVILHKMLALEKKLIPELRDKNLIQVYQDFDLPLAATLLRMEARGIRLDIHFLNEFSVELKKEILENEQKIQELAGEKFNVASPKQLGVILFEKLKLPVIKKTKTGFSTDNEVLEKLDHPISKLVLEYRELAKLNSTYVEALPVLASLEDQRIHTHFNQALTTTGRLSSTNPNIQNIPIRTERGQKVRKAFIAAPGKQLLSVDYSQIELRILAHISEDPGLCQAFRDDLDIHAATAAEIFNIPLTEVSSDQRRTAKAVNFGIAYGQGAFGLADTLGISRSEASEIIKKYFIKFKGVQDYIEGTVKTAHEKGFVETLFGRRRYIDELQSKNQMIKKFGERAAINAPIQGTASDLVKKAMIELDREVPVPMLLQVHDELIFEETREQLDLHLPRIKHILENVAAFKVPLKVNAAIGLNWDEAH